MMKSRMTYWLTMVAGGVALSAAILAATDGPLTPWGNLRGRTDNNGYVMVSAGTPGTTDGPLTLFPQLRTRTDENGYLRVALSGGAVIPSANCYGWSTDTFLQRVAAANVGVSATCGGANTGTFTGGVLATGDGTVSAPSLKFASDTNVGWYRRGANEWNWSYAGSERYRIGVNFEFGGPLNVGNTTLGFSTGIGATPDIYLRRGSAGVLGVSANGTTNGGTLEAGTVTIGGATLTNSSATIANFNGAIETGAASYAWAKSYVYIGPTAGTQGRFGWLATGSLDLRAADGSDTGIFNVKTLRLTPGTFASCPAAPTEGMECSVTDSSTDVWGATVTDGGTLHVLARYNGTNWTVAAK